MITERVALGTGSAVRLLSVRSDHVCSSPAGNESSTGRSGNRRSNVRKYLPLRHLPAHPPRDPTGGKNEGLTWAKRQI